MMGTVASTLTRDECRRYASHQWNDAWDEFYFEADGKTVARDVAEMVLAKAERWTAHLAAISAAEPKAAARAAEHPRLRGGPALPGVAKASALDFSAIVVEKRGQHLRGTRGWVFQAVAKWRADPDAAKLFWLVGGGGTGKSVAAAELLARLLDKENVAAWHFCKHTEPARSAPAALLRSLAGMLCATVQGFENELRTNKTLTDKIKMLTDKINACDGEDETGKKKKLHLRKRRL